MFARQLINTNERNSTVSEESVGHTHNSDSQKVIGSQGAISLMNGPAMVLQNQMLIKSALYLSHNSIKCRATDWYLLCREAVHTHGKGHRLEIEKLIMITQEEANM